MTTSHSPFSNAFSPPPFLGSRSPRSFSTWGKSSGRVLPRLNIATLWPRARAYSIVAGPRKPVPPRTRIRRCSAGWAGVCPQATEKAFVRTTKTARKQRQHSDIKPPRTLGRLLSFHLQHTGAGELAGKRPGVEDDLHNVRTRSLAGHSTRVRTEAASRETRDTATDGLTIHRQEHEFRGGFR
jgi:hypothetical protein